MSLNQHPYNPVNQNPYPQQQLDISGQNQIENGQNGAEIRKPDGKYSLQFSETTIRAGFVRKVFSLVFVMLCIVAGAAFVPIIHDPSREMIRNNQPLYLGSYVIFFVTYLSLVCCEGVRRKFPVNLIVTGVFTLATSVTTMVLSAHHDTKVVLLSLTICVGCTLSIIAFASQTRFDLTARRGYLFVATMCFTMFGLVVAVCSFFTETKLLLMIYALVGALLMMLYLFLDIQMIMGGRKHSISPEDYIFASVQIFVDIVYIFWYLLSFSD